MRPRDTIFVRVAILLLAAVVLTQFATYFAIRQFGRGPASELISSVIASQVRPEAGVRGPIPDAPLDMQRSAPPPRAGPPRIPFDRKIAERVIAKLPPASEVRFSATPRDRTMWVRVGEDGSWLKVSGFGETQRALSVLVFTALVAGLLVVVGAAIAARVLTRPLARLAARAPDLVLGRETRIPRGPSEVRRLGRSLVETARRRAEAERERELLLAGISHDLRSPLARLRLRAQMSGHDAFDEDLDELEAIVDSFIGFVRDGRDEAAEFVDIDEWLAGIAEPYREQDLELNVTPCRARIRPLSLKRAVVNLIDNAFAHGRPPVSIGCRAEQGEAVIEIADRGAGLPEDRLRSALRPFETFDAARGSRHCGLGLPTVQRIATRHNGRLVLSNRADGGLLAEIRLPVDA